MYTVSKRTLDDNHNNKLYIAVVLKANDDDNDKLFFNRS